ncbi:MAG: hypothetical protein OXC83_00685 [Chloroflexi bacterium]|nr:hypothetical protein [Chloroflexota bacterium]
MSQIELVRDDSRLTEVVEHLLRTPRVAVDIESNGFFRYHERVCLVQLASAETAFLVDPLLIDNVRPLGGLLGDRSVEKVFHAADYDLRSFDRDWGFRINNVFDTKIAAEFVGAERVGLQAVVEEYAGVVLAKSPKLQRSDWTMRPLKPEKLQYAANDVLHLIRVRKAISARLKKLSRYAWVQEEFARLESVKHTAPDREAAFLSVKGSRDLDGKGLAVLRSLFKFREREARRRDRPTFKVIPDFALITLSSAPSIDLSRVKGLGWYGRHPGSRGLKDAIRKGLRSKPVSLPLRRRSEEISNLENKELFKTRLSILKAWRSQLGNELRLNPGLLWPTKSLERLARNPCNLELEATSAEVRDWQKLQFGANLRHSLEKLS